MQQVARFSQVPAALIHRPRAQLVPFGIAAACALLLIPSWLHPKTVWVHDGGTTATQGWGRQNVTAWAGALALAALVAGFRTLRTARAASLALAAAALFALAAGEATRAAFDLAREAANPALHGWGEGWTVTPATGMGPTAAIALVGAAAALVLAGIWLPTGADG